MKPEHKPLKELDNNLRRYKTKVKVLHKGHPQQSSNRRRYQHLILKDDEGFTMKGTLINDDIEHFADIIQTKGEYELDDAAINSVPSQYALKPNEYSMIINEQATIKPLFANPTMLGPQYQALSSILEDPFSGEMHGQ